MAINVMISTYIEHSDDAQYIGVSRELSHFHVLWLYYQIFMNT